MHAEGSRVARRLRVVCVTAGLLLLAAPGTRAEGRGVELGFDAGVNVQVIDDIEEIDFQIGLPAQSFGSLSIFTLQTVRIGVPIGHRHGLESHVGFTYNDVSGGDVEHLGFGLGPIFNLGGSADRPSVYVRLAGQFRVFAFGDGFFGNASSQLGIEEGVGIRLPAGRDWAVRIEGGAARWFETDDIAGYWNLGGKVGISVFAG